MVKQLIYDSCMIVEKGTIMFVCYDIQVIYNKHDGMIVVFDLSYGQSDKSAFGYFKSF